ncbi:MAG TPA: zinc dependent phospholipase C family protein [Allosphingosinicella sp.]|nr:zinc dependent phospholipase C family protein [Allosphingosinicella sp.]
MGKRLLLLAGAASIAAATVPGPAQAFGLRTHLYIADQVWQDLSDCRVSIRGQDFAVPAEACRAIRAHRGEFLAGALGPDVFPDVLVGQAIIHPGVAGGWQAADWLNHLLVNARTDDQLAFAWGYAMHYAGDAFAHSYVNNYAGGVFEIGADRTKAIELRHFRLEKYIDQRLDYSLDPALIRAPAAWLAQQLIHYDYAAGGGPRTGDFYASAAADPAGFVRAAQRRLRAGGVAAPATTILTMLDLARVARARAPGQEAAERARLDAALAAARAVERRHNLPASDSMVFDERSPGFAGLNSTQRSEVQAAYRVYRAQVESWQQARALTIFTAEWARDLEVVAQRYIEASLEFGQNMIREGGANRPPLHERTSPTIAYRRWLACYAPVLEGQPAAAGDLVCARLQAMRSDLALRRAALLSSLGAQPRSTYFRLLQLDEYLGGLVEDFVVGLVGLRDQSFADLLDEGLAPTTVTAETLNATFAAAPNGQLAFRCAADWIDADLGLRAPLASGADNACDNAPRTRATLDPARFAALDDALVLARLSLLDQQGVRAVTARFGGNPAEPRMGTQRRYSVLLDSVRSLDGSHQWRGTAMPAPRRQAWRTAPPALSAGFAAGAATGPTGFPLYQSAALRRTVFTALFRPFEGAILLRTEMQPAAYPFRPCDGDPLRGPPLPGQTPLC